VTHRNTLSYDEMAGWYDAIYDARSKDYVAEAAALLRIAAELGVHLRSVLDVACGTGRHLRALQDRFDDLSGVDASESMLTIAAQRLGPQVPLRVVDFTSFDLGRTFDLVTCLFSSVGHVDDGAELDAAMRSMARHVAPGGLLFVEPWLTPERARHGVVDLVSATTDEGVVARAVSSAKGDDDVTLHFAWAVATTSGAATAEEVLRMPLFTADRYLASVVAAGLVGEWRDEVSALGAGRGLLIGRRPEP
jgi:SAM-dependent methyltransferase